MGWNIRRLRVDRGVTIEALADDADVSSAYLAQLERGEVNAGIDLLARITSALSVTLAELVVLPAPGAKPPKPLRAGRKRK